MKNHLLKTILLFFAAITISFAANENIITSQIKGRVIDYKTKKPLPGVNVMIEHTTIGNATNADGEFVIAQVPVGSIKLVATFIGYKPETKIIELDRNGLNDVLFALREGAFEMGSVVVTGTSTPHLYEDMPVKTELISAKTIDQQKAVNLAQALGLQTGVRVENNCQNCNFTQVRILGFDGRYTQILIDGDPVVSSVGGVYGLEHYPNDMIEQIEIVKGGGSALYGGGAIAGTVNLITRRPAFNRTKISGLYNSLDGESDYKIGAMAEVVSEDGKSGAYIFGSTRSRSAYDHNGDGFSELGQLKNETIGFNWYYRPTQATDLMLSFNRIHEDRRGGNDFDKPQHESAVAEWLEHLNWGAKVRWMHRLSENVDYKLAYSFSHIDRKSYFGGLGGDTPEDQLAALKAYGNTKNPLHIVSGQMNVHLKGHLLTGGFQYYSDRVEDNSVSNPLYSIDETYTNFGLFIQDNLHFGDNDQLEIVLGARMDKHSELEDPTFSPRMNIKYAFDNGIIARAAVTTGFKAPQTYNEDLHIGGLEGSQRVIRNAPDLDPEKSFSVSGGLEYQGFFNDTPILIGVTGFYTEIKDAFGEKYIKKENDVALWHRINSSGSKAMGVELDLGIKPTEGIELRGGFTVKKGEYDEKHADFDTKDFLRTPDVFGYLRATVELTHDIEFFVAGKYTGEAKVPHEIPVDGQEDPMLKLETSDTFFEVDLGMSFNMKFMKSLTPKLSIGVKNISNAYQDDLDKGADRDPAYVFGPITPRTYYCGLDFSF